MNTIKSNQSKFAASYGSSGFAENDTNYMTQKNFFNSKTQFPNSTSNLNLEQNQNQTEEAFNTFKKSNTFNNDTFNSNNNNYITATFHKKSKNLSENEKMNEDINYYNNINDKKKMKVLNMIKNAHIEKIKNFIFLKEINYAYEEIQRYTQEGDYASAKDMERYLLSLQNDVIQLNIDKFSKSKLGRSHATFGKSFKTSNYTERNNNNIQRIDYKMNEDEIEEKKIISVNKINKRNKSKNNINNRNNYYEVPQNDIMNFERNKNINNKNKIPIMKQNDMNDNIDNNNIIYNQIPPNDYQNENIPKEENIQENQPNINEINNKNNNNNNFQPYEKIIYNINENIQLNKENQQPQNQLINKEEKPKKPKIKNKIPLNKTINLKDKNKPIKKSDLSSQQNDNNNLNNIPKEILEHNPRASYENFEAKILKELDKNPETNTFIVNNGPNISTNPNLNSLNLNITKSNNQIQFSSDLPVSESTDPFNNSKNPFDNLPESGIFPKFSQNAELPYNPKKDNEIPNNKYPNYEDVDKNNLNNLSQNPQENNNINNNIDNNQENAPVPEENNQETYVQKPISNQAPNDINDINNHQNSYLNPNNIINEQKNHEIIPQENNPKQNIPQNNIIENNKPPQVFQSYPNPKKQNKKIKRPKSSKNNINTIKKNNSYNLPNFDYPRNYYKPNNLLEKKLSKSKSKSNSRESSNSPKILFAEPSIGKCFACDINCSISRSGNSPNKYVPYYGPLKKERKHITEYDGEKYGYYQYKSRIPENA